MIFEDIEQFAAILPQGALLGLDIGSKVIGVALSDSRRKIASPYEGIDHRKFTESAARISAIITERHVVGIVMGYPITMQGTKGKACQSVKQFATNLSKLLPTPIFLQDERLTTFAAKEVLEESGMAHSKRIKVVDKVAASYILQAALDRLL